MKLTLPIALLWLTASSLWAHFTFVVPEAGGRHARLVMSEDLDPDPAVGIQIVSGAKLFLRDEAGKDTPLELVKDDFFYRLATPGKGVRLIHGVADLGVMTRGPKAFLLIYHPKTVVGAAFGEKTVVGGAVPVELVPVGRPGALSFRVVAQGRALPDTEVQVVLPDGSQTKVKTDAAGVTPPFPQHGRFGAWARFFEPVAGERDGKKFEETRHYATLVVDSLPVAVSEGKLPEATSSFGAVADGNWLYVYGGHIAKTHSYDRNSVSGRFARMNLQTKAWEELPAGPKLQGMNLAAYKGQIIRVGGMEPRNAPGEKQAIFSVADVARFDPATKQWHALPSLPSPRSSHDVVVIGDTLVVAGGWNLLGAEGSEWAQTCLTLNLADPRAQWETLPQPFERRALIAAAHDGKMWVMGGIMKSGAVSNEVDVFDPAGKTWSKAPALPGTGTQTFAPAAAVWKGNLYVSLADGAVVRFDRERKMWAEAGFSSRRLAHRAVGTERELLLLGGAEKGNNLDLVESLFAQPSGSSD